MDNERFQELLDYRNKHFSLYEVEPNASDARFCEVIDFAVQLKAMNNLLDEHRCAYQGFTNVIDDYFEYRCISEQDQEYVHNALKRLTDILKELT